MQLEIEQKPVNGVAVRFISGPLTGEVITITKHVTEIGRDEKNDIVIVDTKVSRHHARIRWLDGSWTIENLSQRSFISINGQRIEQGILQHNSVVNVGEDNSFLFLLQSPAQQPLPPSTVVKVPANVPLYASPSGTVLATSEPSLIVSSNVHSGQQVYALKGDVQVFNIGRDASNTIAINESIVSALHAQIIREDGHLVLVHPHPAREKTLNGLWYQGRRINGNETFCKQLEHGDIIRIGDEHGRLVTLSYDDGTDASLETMPEMQAVPLNSDRLTIGRESDNTVVLNHPQVSAHHAVLEKAESGYCIIDTNSTNHVYVNGDLVTNHTLRTGDLATNHMLRTSDEIRIGPYRLIYTGTELRPYDESSNVRIEALDLKKVSKKNIVLLNDISLVIPPRKFVALVGGSGAGKSMLMDALNGLRPAHKGTVLYNGENYYHNLAAFSTQLGYVPQDDIVHRDLTVERALYYAARLRLPSDFTKEQIQWRINEVLEDVEMTDRRTLMVSQLSGGQRKRVSIALELLANPGVFFLDEPTSGLDPSLDRKMMVLLRRLADRGHTIILATHATNNINDCDYVCFLAQGGRLTYFGPPNEAKTFFAKADFTEIYSSLEPSKDHPDIPQQAEARFLVSADYQRYVAGPLREGQLTHKNKKDEIDTQSKEGKTRQRVKRGNPWSQFLLLSMRYLELLKNDRGTLLILLLQAPLIAIILILAIRSQLGTGVFDANNVVQCRTQTITSSGPLALPQAQKTDQINCDTVLTFLKKDSHAQAYVHKKGGQEQALQDFILPMSGASAQKVLFIMAFTAVLFGCINSAREFVKEAAIYKRERSVNLGILPYMFSKIVVLGMLCLFQSAVLVLIMNLGEPLHQSIFLNPLLETYITLALVSLAGLMIGLAISAIAPNNDRAMSFVPIILVPQLIYSGSIVPIKDWFTQIMAILFPTRWAMAALGSSIGLHSDKIEGDKLIGNDTTFHGTLFSVFSKTDALHRLILSWISLGVIILVLMIVIVVFLKLKDIHT
jgi:ABC-type multidrug transport system ATPase subunit/pSer/pThr/pTyr-binding forkhead associated (FHA) protein